MIQRRRFAIRIASIAIAAAGLGGCSIEPGRVRIAFVWEEPPPSGSDLVLHVAIEERADPLRPGRLLATAIAPVDSSVDLAIGDVPNGDDRVVIAEVREPDRTGGRLVFRGVSNPFSLRAGEVTEATVALGLERLVSLRGVSIRDATPFGFVRSSTVTLQVRATGADSFQVFADDALDALLTEVNAHDVEVGTATSGETPYDLPTMLGAEDGPRTLYVRALDRAGYTSDVHELDVVLDRHPPQLVFADITLRAAVGNVSASDTGTVAAATVGTEVVVTFAVDEPLALDPVVATAAPAEWSIPLAQRDGEVYSYNAVLTESALDTGLYAVEITMTDRAGWVVTSTTVARLYVITTSPLPPEGSKIQHRRLPWGTGGVAAAQQWLESNECCQPGLTLVAFDTADPVERRLIGRSAVHGDGGITPIALSGSDRAEVWVAHADAAGNLSEAVRAGQGQWTATLLGRRLDDPLVNPHRLLVTDRVTHTLQPDLRLTNEPDPASAAAPDGAVLTARSMAGWRRIPGASDSFPGPREGAALVYDRRRGQVLLFGGEPDDGRTWQWDGGEWVDVTPVQGTPRFGPGAAVVYDAARARVLAFSAVQDSLTRAFDGDRWSIVAPSPSGLEDMSAAYDSVRGRVVAFGGRDRSTARGDTWVLESAGWARVSRSGPSPRWGAAMAFDEARGLVVMFGGENESGLLRDTWTWDGARWAPHAVSGPPTSMGASIAYDPHRQRTVLTPGQIGGVQPVWEWDGASWSEVIVAPGPDARQHAAVTYDAANRRLLFFGGHSQSGLQNDLWSYDGAQWTRLDDRQTPPGRVYGRAVYRGSTGEVVMCCGFSLATFGEYGDTWTFDGDAWRAGPPLPLVRRAPALSYDTRLSKIFALGGSNSRLARDGFDYDCELDGSSWRCHDPATPRPDPRYGAAAAYDERRGVTVVHGGYRQSTRTYYGDTWTWDGSEWTPIATPIASPGPRGHHTMVYDRRRGVIVMYGGRAATSVVLDDHWEWDGQIWHEVPPSGPRPSARSEYAMVYDPAREQVILFGGLTMAAELQSDVWTYDGTRWQQIVVGGLQPPGMYLQHAAFHEPTRSLVVGGGIRAYGPGDTWIFPERSDRPVSPAVQLSFDWGAASVDASALTSIAVDAVVGGYGRTSSTAPPRDGVELQAWDTYVGRWVSWAETNTSTIAPGALHHEDRSTPVARYVDVDQRIHIRFVARSPFAGAIDRPRVVVDSVELDVEYTSVGR